jgi:hypothetical protein
MLLELLKLLPEPLPTPPTLHLPARPISRLKSLTLLLKRKLVHAHQEACGKAQIMLLVLDPRRVHVATKNVDVQMVHTRVRVHACDDLPRVVSAWCEVRPESLGRGRGHVGVQRRLIRRVRSAEVAELPAQLRCRKHFQARNASAEGGEQGGVVGEGGKGVLGVDGRGAGKEEEVYAADTVRRLLVPWE